MLKEIDGVAKRDWLSIGEHCNATASQKRHVGGLIKQMEWIEPEGSHPAMPGMGIEGCIKEFRIPKVSRISYNVVAYNRYGFYGVEGNYENGRVRIYFLDRGAEIIPIAADRMEG